MRAFLEAAGSLFGDVVAQKQKDITNGDETIHVLLENVEERLSLGQL